jgi:hypothetical protein
MLIRTTVTNPYKCVPSYSTHPMTEQVSLTVNLWTCCGAECSFRISAGIPATLWLVWVFSVSPSKFQGSTLSRPRSPSFEIISNYSNLLLSDAV